MIIVGKLSKEDKKDNNDVFLVLKKSITKDFTNHMAF